MASCLRPANNSLVRCSTAIYVSCTSRLMLQVHNSAPNYYSMVP
jgi:hypothetical protein